MKFTYKAYSDLIDLLKEKGYFFSNYFKHKEQQRAVIFRHDVDYSLQKALELATLEYDKGVKSTYFVLISTDFYNLFSKNSYEMLKKLIDLNHEVGLHFDEKRYQINDFSELEFYVNKERRVLEELIDKKVETVSMHRPSKWILENDIKFESILNTYSTTFFKEFKYISDSRMHWREDVLSIINDGIFDKLHILTHPFWYANKEETMREKLFHFITSAKEDRYIILQENFRDLGEVLELGDIINENKN